MAAHSKTGRNRGLFPSVLRSLSLTQSIILPFQPVTGTALLPAVCDLVLSTEWEGPGVWLSLPPIGLLPLLMSIFSLMITYKNPGTVTIRRPLRAPPAYYACEMVTLSTRSNVSGKTLDQSWAGWWGERYTVLGWWILLPRKKSSGGHSEVQLESPRSDRALTLSQWLLLWGRNMEARKGGTLQLPAPALRNQVCWVWQFHQRL